MVTLTDNLSAAPFARRANGAGRLDADSGQLGTNVGSIERAASKITGVNM